MTLKKAEESGLISVEQYEDKQREFLQAIKFVAEDGEQDSGMLVGLFADVLLF
jgi:hypothetical protein